MRTVNLKYVSTISVQKKFIFLCALLFISGKILSGSVAYGNNLTFDSKSGGSCGFSLKVQNSPDREVYISRLAIEIGNYFASNQDSTVMSDVEDDSFSLFAKTSPTNASVDDIDSFSKDCLTCHNGSSAVDINANYRNSPTNWRSRNLNATEHPIGMDYEKYVASGRENFKPIPMGSSTLILIKGKVGCLTCHNPLNPERKHLVMSDVRSTLCLTCHDK